MNQILSDTEYAVAKAVGTKYVSRDGDASGDTWSHVCFWKDMPEYDEEDYIYDYPDHLIFIGSFPPESVRTNLRPGECVKLNDDGSCEYAVKPTEMNCFCKRKICDCCGKVLPWKYYCVIGADAKKACSLDCVNALVAKEIENTEQDEDGKYPLVTISSNVWNPDLYGAGQ